MTRDTYAPPVPESARTSVLILHLSALAGVFTGIGFFLGPLVVWLLKRGDDEAFDEAGKDAVNSSSRCSLAASWPESSASR